MYEDQPVGNICVLRDPMGAGWTVSICRGLANPTLLGRFDERAKAMAFALEERERRREADKVELTVHFPDDCPCYRTYRAM